MADSEFPILPAAQDLVVLTSLQDLHKAIADFTFEASKFVENTNGVTYREGVKKGSVQDNIDDDLVTVTISLMKRNGVNEKFYGAFTWLDDLIVQHEKSKRKDSPKDSPKDLLAVLLENAILRALKCRRVIHEISEKGASDNE